MSAYNQHLRSKKHSKRSIKKSSVVIDSQSNPILSSATDTSAVAPAIAAIAPAIAPATGPVTVTSGATTTNKSTSLSSPNNDQKNDDKQDTKMDDKEDKKEDQLDSEISKYACRTAVPIKTCIFCGVQFDTIDTSLDHMLKIHGFFIPFVEYLVDLEGLLEYLGAKVGFGHVCLYCNGRTRAAYGSLQAVRQHMDAKFHCKIRLDDNDEQELINFYQFPNSDNDQDANQDDKMYTNDLNEEILKDKNQVKNQAVETKNINTQLVPVNNEAGLVKVERIEPARQVASVNEIGELIMNDGSVIGHRSMKIYYRQNLKPRPSRHLVLLQQMVSTYRTLQLPGYHPDKNNDGKKAFQAIMQKQRMKVGVKGNSLQKHFRAQINF